MQNVVATKEYFIKHQGCLLQGYINLIVVAKTVNLREVLPSLRHVAILCFRQQDN